MSAEYNIVNQENIMGRFSHSIWEGVRDPREFTATNSPIESLIRPDWNGDANQWNWKSIKEVTPGTGMFIPGFTVGLESIIAADLLKRDMFLDIGSGPTALTTTQGRFVYAADPQIDRPVLPHRAIKAVAEDLPFEGEIFDGIYSDKCVGFYPEKMNYWQALSEALRVLKVDRPMVIRTGMGMNDSLYKETEKRMKKLGHEGVFPGNSSFFMVFKRNPDFILPGTNYASQQQEQAPDAQSEKQKLTVWNNIARYLRALIEE